MSKFKKFLFFLSSLIPGAGHMFLGFMKRGLLLMTIYFIDIGLSMILNGFLVFMPVIWFYCLFDAWNKFFLSDEEKRRVDDSFIFFYNAIPEELLPKSQRFSNKIPPRLFRAIGSVLIFFGIVMLCRELRENLKLPQLASQILSFVPELLISTALIAVGIRLIAHKKKEIYSDSFSLEGSGVSGSSFSTNENNMSNIEDSNKASINDIKPKSVELLKSIADDEVLSSSENNSKISKNDILNKNELAGKDILNDIDSSLSPLFEGVEDNSDDNEIEYIWSSPVKSDDNPQ